MELKPEDFNIDIEELYHNGKIVAEAECDNFLIVAEIKIVGKAGRSYEDYRGVVNLISSVHFDIKFDIYKDGELIDYDTKDLEKELTEYLEKKLIND